MPGLREAGPASNAIGYGFGSLTAGSGHVSRPGRKDAAGTGSIGSGSRSRSPTRRYGTGSRTTASRSAPVSATGYAAGPGIGTQSASGSVPVSAAGPASYSTASTSGSTDSTT